MKPFSFPPGEFQSSHLIGFIIEDSLSPEEITQRLEKIKQFQFERVGQLIESNLIAINTNPSRGKIP